MPEGTICDNGWTNFVAQVLIYLLMILVTLKKDIMEYFILGLSNSNQTIEQFHII